MDTYNKPIPDLDDPDMAPFWEATRQHRLTAQRCTDCHAHQFPGLPMCGSCLSEAVEWVEVSGTGTVWSYVVYHRAFHPGFSADVPYAVAVVENAEGVRYTGMVVGPREGLQVGSPVVAHFDDATPEFTMVQWILADTAVTDAAVTDTAVTDDAAGEPR